MYVQYIGELRNGLIFKLKLDFEQPSNPRFLCVVNHGIIKDSRPSELSEPYFRFTIVIVATRVSPT